MKILSFLSPSSSIPTHSPKHPKYAHGFKEAAPKTASKKKGLPDGIRMSNWGKDSRPKMPVRTTTGINFIEWEVVAIESAQLRGSFSAKLDQFDYEQIDHHGLNGEVYEAIKIDVLMGMPYGDIAKARKKSRAWVDQVARFIKRAEEERLIGP